MSQVWVIIQIMIDHLLIMHLGPLGLALFILAQMAEGVKFKKLTP